MSFLDLGEAGNTNDWLELEHEQDERRDAEQSVAIYKRQLSSLREKCASIDVEIQQYHALSANLRRGSSIPLVILRRR